MLMIVEVVFQEYYYSTVRPVLNTVKVLFVLILSVHEAGVPLHSFGINFRHTKRLRFC
jgi:hypothetical protein